MCKCMHTHTHICITHLIDSEGSHSPRRYLLPNKYVNVSGSICKMKTTCSGNHAPMNTVLNFCIGDVPQHICVGQRTTCRESVFSSIIRVPRSQGLNSHCQAWRQVPLPGEPYGQSLFIWVWAFLNVYIGDRAGNEKLINNGVNECKV